MKLFFDLDGTLINTALLKQYLLDFCQQAGLDKKQAAEVYVKSRDNGSKVTFTIQLFLQTLSEKLPQWHAPSVERMEVDLADYIELLPGALDLLQAVAEEEYYLLSLGEPCWQNWKLRAAGIERFFSIDRRLYTPTPITGKRELIETCFGKDLHLFFNDNLEECRQLLVAGSNNIVFLIADSVPEELVSKYPEQLYVADSLTGIGKFINEFRLKIGLDREGAICVE